MSAETSAPDGGVQILVDKKILVIDDEAFFLSLLEKALSREKAVVYTARSGHEGLQQLRLCQPDLVLLDIRMPTMDGWETYRRIRQLSPVPVIMLSALEEEYTLDAQPDALNDYITKPIRLGDLVARIQAALEG